jgi:hypothetical protein
VSAIKQLTEYMDKPTLERAKATAEAYLKEQGDYPDTLAYEMGMVKIDNDKLADVLIGTRDAHFKAKGKKPPPFPMSEDSL